MLIAGKRKLDERRLVGMETAAIVANARQCAIASSPSGWANDHRCARTCRRKATFSQGELDKFNELAHRCWDPEGPQKALHALNPARLGYVADASPCAAPSVLDVAAAAACSARRWPARARMSQRRSCSGPAQVARLHGLESRAEVDYRLIAAEELAAEKAGHVSMRSPAWNAEHVPDPASVRLPARPC